MFDLHIKAADGLQLSVAYFSVEKPIGTVQIIHGAKEHKARYYPFARFLQANGFAVVLSDNRGHGSSVNENYPLGYMENMDEIIADQYLITQYMKEMYPQTPLYLFGHSLGSVFARCYLQKHEDQIDKLILSGTVNYVPGVNIGIFLGKLITRSLGKYGYHAFLEKLSLKNQKGDAWISVSEENLKRYREDPLCQFDYKNQAVMTIFQGVKRLQDDQRYSCYHPHLPILSMSGDGDPITGGTKGIQHSMQTLKNAGYRNVNHVLYADVNHEVLNEENYDLVYAEILRFLLADNDMTSP